jgi:8-oxo-dGTP pyrophosphatase MutT (NUDIX family)
MTTEPTLREEVEAELGLTAKPARVGKRYYAAPAWAPSHWRKTLRVWAITVLVFVAVSFVGGLLAGMASKVLP